MGRGGEGDVVSMVEDGVKELDEQWYESEEYGCECNARDAISSFPLFLIGKGRGLGG